MALGAWIGVWLILSIPASLLTGALLRSESRRLAAAAPRPPGATILTLPVPTSSQRRPA